MQKRAMRRIARKLSRRQAISSRQKTLLITDRELEPLRFKLSELNALPIVDLKANPASDDEQQAIAFQPWLQ